MEYKFDIEKDNIEVYKENKSYQGNNSIKRVYIDKNTSEIKRNAFKGCSNLEVVIIEEGSLKNISDYAFANCSSLITILIPDSVKKIGNNAFIWGNDNLCIYCNKNSYTEKFAKSRGIKYEYLSADFDPLKKPSIEEKVENDNSEIDLSKLKNKENQNLIEYLESKDINYVICQLIQTMDVLKNVSEEKRKLEEDNKALINANKKLLKQIEQFKKSSNSKELFSQSKIDIIKNMVKKGINTQLIAMEFNCSVDDIEKIINKR